MQGILQASMHVGGATAPMVAAWIIDVANWPLDFPAVRQAAGIVWAAAFCWWFRDQPSEHPAVNAAELDLIGMSHVPVQGHDSVSWREVFTHPNIWLLSFIITMSAFNSYFFFTWYPTYLEKARGVNNKSAGALASLALFGAVCGSLLGGWLADRITRRAADLYRVRRHICLAAYICAAAFLFVGVSSDETWILGLCCALACLSLFIQLPTWWAALTM